MSELYNALTRMVIPPLNPFLLKQMWSTDFFPKKSSQILGFQSSETLVFDETFTSEPSKKFSRSRMKLSKVSRRSA